MNDNYWDKFKQTGKILDYINYTSCTNEESVGISKTLRNKGERIHEASANSYRDSINSNTRG